MPRDCCAGQDTRCWALQPHNFCLRKLLNRDQTLTFSLLMSDVDAADHGTALERLQITSACQSGYGKHNQTVNASEHMKGSWYCNVSQWWLP